MREIDIEHRILQIVDQIRKKAPVEDDRIELKAEWIDPIKAARRIAAHANSSYGEYILWVMGLNENKGAVGVEKEEFSNWWATVKSQFEGLAPTVQMVNVPTEGITLVGLLFDTTRSPFVVKNPAFGQPNSGSIEYEVPWREGGGTPETQ
jgi:hypothetical protein